MYIPILTPYTRWLHTRYPAGKAEKLPEVQDDGSTTINGLYVVGDLKGIPLLKFSTDSGARVVDLIKESNHLKKAQKDLSDDSIPDVLIIGAGVAGISAALRAKKHGLSYRVLEAGNTFSTIINFPKKKPIYTYPKDFEPDTELETTGDVKESLLEELLQQVKEAEIEVEEGVAVDHVKKKGAGFSVILKDGDPIQARTVIVAIGRSGNYRKLDIPGEDLDKVSNRLHDPADFSDKKVVVVGGGDSALEAAISLAENNAEVILSYRKHEFSRPKPENVDKIHKLASSELGNGKIRLLMNSAPKEITEDKVVITNNKTKEEETYQNDYTFALIGREAPLEFFRKSGVPINGEWNPLRVMAFSSFLIFCVWMYMWKAGSGPVYNLFADKGWFPFNLGDWFSSFQGSLADALADPSHILGTLAISLSGPAFYYTFLYSACVVIFGIKRIRKRRTPYITYQTIALMIIQTFPLFLLPEIFLPWAGANGAFDSGFLKSMADGLFPEVDWGHGRQYWRAYGLILAWPLFIYNFFTSEPMVWWLVIGSLQTFVLIPAMIYFWGKGSYCGWICSCGALAETLGDEHRHKMPHGPFWSRLNMTGQVILWIALILMGVRVYGWWAVSTVKDDEGNINWEEYDQLSWLATGFDFLIDGKTYESSYTSDTGEAVGEQNIYWEDNTAYVLDDEGYYIEKDDGSYLTATYEENVTINYFTYKWVVDTLLAGIIGVGFYFWFSGRVWCRFACPLAALMHIYTKFSRFRIISDKKKCISCNVCTSVCHQGIDIMNFANKGVPMEDPECVRCSACVQSCPTGVLQFGQVDKDGNTIKYDSVPASPVLMKEEQKTRAQS